MRFCFTADGARLAWTDGGPDALDGGHPDARRRPAVLVPSSWFGNVDLQGDAEVWAPFLAALGRHARIVRFDRRGVGHSDEGHPGELVDTWVGDVETVAAAAGLDRFVLLGGGRAAGMSIAFAAHRPERVRGLVLYGGASSTAHHPAQRALCATLGPLLTMARPRHDRLVEQFLASLMLPEGSEPQLGALGELILQWTRTTTGEHTFEQGTSFDVRHLLDEVDAATLVVHSTGDGVVPFDEARLIARRIRGARLLPIASRNHLVLPDEPPWHTVVDEIVAFVAGLDEVAASGGPEDGRRATSVADLLSTREMEVLQLVAIGADNVEIAAKLFLSVRTVERHLHHIYVKLGLQGKSARAAAVAQLLSAR